MVVVCESFRIKSSGTLEYFILYERMHVRNNREAINLTDLLQTLVFLTIYHNEVARQIFRKIIGSNYSQWEFDHAKFRETTEITLVLS
jgi:hypothetical protein